MKIFQLIFIAIVGFVVMSVFNCESANAQQQKEPIYPILKYSSKASVNVKDKITHIKDGEIEIGDMF